MAYIHESNVTLFLVSMQWNFETNLTPFAAFACVHTSVVRYHTFVFFFATRTALFGDFHISNTLWDLHIFFPAQAENKTHTWILPSIPRLARPRASPRLMRSRTSRYVVVVATIFFNVVVSVTTTRFYLCPIFVRTSPPRVVRFHFWEILAFSRILCDECSSLSLLKLALIITHDQYYQ